MLNRLLRLEDFILREIGNFDKYFYYIMSGKGSTGEIRMILKFKVAVNYKALLSAANEALNLFPEFAVRPVLKGNKLFYEENHNPVALLPLGSYDFGTSDMNGYLFCIQADRSKEREIQFSAYHGLSDFSGLYRFFKTIICRYAIHAKGLPDDYFNSVIRSKAPDKSEWETEENLKPYEIFAKQYTVPPYRPEISGEVFHMEETLSLDFTAARRIKITVSKSKFLSAAKKYNTNFVPYFLYIASNAVRDAFNTDKNILVVLPADMKSVFKIDCITNFTCSLLLPSTLAEHKAPVEEQCRRFRKMIELQKQPENCARLLYDKVQKQNDIFSSPESIISKSREIISKIPETAKLLSMPVSYPGSIDMPEGADDLFEDIIVTSATSLLIDGQSYRDKFSIISTQCYNSDKIAKAICNRLSSEGLESTITDIGPIEHNIMNLEKLKRV